MRPVNLIPSNERRGASRGSAQSTGYAPYIVLGVLAFAVLGMYLMVSTSNSISEKESELAQLKQDAELAQTAQQQTSSSGNIKAVAQGQFDAVASTIDSRFNFERRLRQLTHVLPKNVTLTDLSAEVAPGGEADAAQGGDEAIDPAVSGPSFDLKMCSSSGGWKTVAVTITRMRNLDGVTKVKVTEDLKRNESGAGGDTGAVTGGCAASSGFTFGLKVSFAFNPELAAAQAALAATLAGSGPRTATEQAQGAADAAAKANEAEGSDQSGGAGVE